jgi:flagellar hook assembly protein FlgD
MEGDLDVIRKDLKENEYRFSNFKKDNETGDTGGNGSYKVNIKKEKDSVYYNLTGIDNGIATVVKFSFMNGCWYMVAIEDSST